MLHGNAFAKTLIWLTFLQKWSSLYKDQEDFIAIISLWVHSGYLSDNTAILSHKYKLTDQHPLAY